MLKSTQLDVAQLRGKVLTFEGSIHVYSFLDAIHPLYDPKPLYQKYCCF